MQAHLIHTHRASACLPALPMLTAQAEQEEAEPVLHQVHLPENPLPPSLHDALQGSSPESLLVLLQTHATCVLQRTDGQNPVESPESLDPRSLTPTMTSASLKTSAPSGVQCGVETSPRNSLLRSLPRAFPQSPSPHVSRTPSALPAHSSPPQLSHPPSGLTKLSTVWPRPLQHPLRCPLERRDALPTLTDLLRQLLLK